MIGGFGQTHSPNTMSAILRNRAVKQALSGAYVGYARGFASVPDAMVSTAAPIPTRADDYFTPVRLYFSKIARLYPQPPPLLSPIDES